MKKILVAVALVVASIVGVMSVQGEVWALTAEEQAKVDAAKKAGGGQCPDNSMRLTYTSSIAECSLPENSPTTGDQTLPDVIKTIVNVVLSIVGILAVVMIILGGISFVTSQGDAAKVTKARNTLLYGVVGLVIALLAFAIVNFVLTSVFTNTDDTAGTSTPA